MNPIPEQYPTTEPLWDSVGVMRTNFSPHWNGDLISLTSFVRPKETESQTAQFVRDCALQIITWVLKNRDQFGLEDRFMIILAWPTTVRDPKRNRQIIKLACTFRDLEEFASNLKRIPLREGWNAGIFKQ